MTAVVVRCGDSALILPTFHDVRLTMPPPLPDDRLMAHLRDQEKRRCYVCNAVIAPGQALVQWLDGQGHLVMQEHVRCPKD